MQKPSSFAGFLWGFQAKSRYLLMVAILLLFAFLGGRDLWTQEHRWAEIVAGMFSRHDFLHPYLDGGDYYDKPLLSYWLIALIVKFTGQLSLWALRLPSALAGLLAVFSIVRLGSLLKDKSMGLLSGWLLITTFYFLFWARTSSADMLNLAGSLFAITWYFEKRDQSNIFNYMIFFLIVALTSLCKGLIGAVIPAIAVMVDIILQRSWKQHLHPRIFIALIPALFVYLLPFWASAHFGMQNYHENGLYLVYKENILRYFKPFDHKGPIYTYFIYLPIYLLPWTFFFIAALFSLKNRWQQLSLHSKWMVWTLFFLFTFLTLSGSRRSYYVLPLIPFAILFTADWILSAKSMMAKRSVWAGVCVAIFTGLLFFIVNLAPTWYYHQTGAARFAAQLKSDVEKTKPLNTFQVVMLDGETKLGFYLHLPLNNKNYPISGRLRLQQTQQSLLKAFPIVLNKPKNTIFITRKLYLPLLQPYFTGYQVVEMTEPKIPFFHRHTVNIPIAFVPTTLDS